MRTLRPADLSFLTSAKVRVTVRGTVAAPVDQVFHAFASDPGGWSRWCPGFTSGSFTTDGEVGVGSTRVVKALGTTFEETYLAYEPSRRWAFTVVACTLPAIREFAEDYVFEADGRGGTRVTWTMAADMPGPALLNKPVVAAQIKLMLAGAKRKMPAYLASK